MSVHISSTQREILMIIFQLIQLRVHILIAYSTRSIYGRKGISCKKKNYNFVDGSNACLCYLSFKTHELLTEMSWWWKYADSKITSLRRKYEKFTKILCARIRIDWFISDFIKTFSVTVLKIFLKNIFNSFQPARHVMQKTVSDENLLRKNIRKLFFHHWWNGLS